MKRSGHYWEIVIDILTDKDSYRATPKYRKSLATTASAAEGGPDGNSLTPQKSKGGKASPTPTTSEGDPDKISLLNEARLALANAAMYRSDTGLALSLYSRVKTAQAAWNQAQVWPQCRVHVHTYNVHDCCKGPARLPRRFLPFLFTASPEVCLFSCILSSCSVCTRLYPILSFTCTCRCRLYIVCVCKIRLTSYLFSVCVRRSIACWPASALQTRQTRSRISFRRLRTLSNSSSLASAPQTMR